MPEGLENGISKAQLKGLNGRPGQLRKHYEILSLHNRLLRRIRSAFVRSSRTHVDVIGRDPNTRQRGLLVRSWCR